MAELPDNASLPAASLTSLSNQIAAETIAGANTTTRNGNMMQSVIDSKVSRVSDRASLSQGEWDASTNAVPTESAAGGDILDGMYWYNLNHASTTLLGPDGGVINPYTKLTKITDGVSTDPADRGNWMLTPY